MMDAKEQDLYKQVRQTLRDWETARMKAEGMKRQFVAAFPPIAGRPLVLPTRAADAAAMKEISDADQEERRSFANHQAALKALKDHKG